MRFGVLGPLAVWTDGGEPVPVPGLKVRALLADLLVNEGQPVSVDRLVEDLWGDAAPGNATSAVQVRVSQLRKALEDAEPGARDLVVSRAPGYLLAATADDAARFAVLAQQARTVDEPRVQAALLADALALWRGPALADFADEEFARPAIVRWEEQRLAVLEEHAEARLELGEHGPLAAELGELVRQHPYRERLRAAHMRALYRAGRQGEALDSYAELRRRLADELGLDPSPELAALHQAMLRQDEALRPRPATNLPAPVGGLIGRDAALAEVRALLATERLVTLTGSGGVGKTSLALAAARADPYPDGAWLVELAALPGAAAVDDVAELVLAALDVRDTPVPARERLAGALRSRNLLLVLDNCEHLVAAAASVAALLLRTAPGVRILATSREPLDLRGEVLCAVPPLDDPSAAELFVARARATAPGVPLDPDAVAAICRRLDGIPLALELAATRVRALGVHELVARLDDRFRLLSTGHRDMPARQRTLTAVIDWSWQLLTEPERVVLRRLAVAADGLTLTAAEAICGEDALDLLGRLVDRSLVVVGDGPRYRLLESVAAYCAKRLREADEVDLVRARHTAYHLDLAERAEPHLYGPEQRRWLRLLDAEAANFRAALEHADATRALRLAGALAWYWFLRGRLADARRSLAAALAVPGDAPPEVRAKALAWHTGISIMLGDTADWATRHREVRRAYEAADDPAGQARAEWFLGFVTVDIGELAAAEELLDRALASFRATGDRWGAAAALSTRAKLAHIRGDLAALERDATRSLELFRALGDGWGRLQATEWLGGLAEMTGDYERATRLNEDGLRLAEELGLWPEAAERLCWLGWIALQLGDYGGAREYAEQGLRLATEQGSQPIEAFARIGLAFAARRDGKLDLAEEQLRYLMELARRADTPPLYVSMVLIELGYLLEQRGEPGAALAAHTEAFDIAHAQGAVRDTAFALEGMAGAVCAHAPARAAELLGAADAARRSTGLPLAPAERDEVARITGTARAALGSSEFDAAFDRGAGWSPVAARSLVRP